MKTFRYFGLFMIINFGSLALGSWLMNNGPIDTWYLQLNKAPWTPPGWVFGAAWFTIMFCFSIYMTYMFKGLKSSLFNILFGLQVFLNVIWNYVFFNLHLILLGLIVITLLTILIFVFYFKFELKGFKTLKLFLLPYMIWLCIAASLNAYIFFYN